MSLHCNNSSHPNLTSALSICDIGGCVTCPEAIWPALKQAGPGCMCPLYSAPNLGTPLPG